MGKKSKQKKAQAAESTSVLASPEIDYHRPSLSYYQIPLITLIIGDKRYGIPEAFLLKYPRFPPRSHFSSNITLHDIHEDAGHTLVHFLYSRKYETINAPLNQDTSDIAREYKRSIFVYQASRKYGIAALEALAQRYIQHFGDGMSLPDILRETRDAFSKLPEGEPRLPCYIKTRLQHMLEPPEIASGLDTFYSSLGQNHHFDSIVLKMVVEALFVRLSSPGRSPEDGKDPRRISVSGLINNGYTGDIATAETIHTDESTFKDGSPTGESAQKDATSGEPNWEEDASPLPIEESAHEDALPEEPTWEEDASPLPAGESAHEDALPEEPTWEEDASLLPAEESAPEDAPPLPEDLPVDETAIVEDAHQDEHPFTRVYLSTAEALPNDGHLGAVQAHLVQVSTRDLALYKGWGKLTLDMKATRAQKLAVKGLPTPDEDGFVSIFVTGAGA